jgi:DNA-binding response OmpR family regulator
VALILVIDDDRPLALTLQRALERGGHEVLLAQDGVAGLKLFQERRPALVVTDVVMPEKEGITTIVDMKRIAPGVKVIAVSGATDTLDLATQFGAERTLMKPIQTKELVAAVDELLNQPGDQ